MHRTSEWLVATGNPHKLAEIRRLVQRILGPILSLRLRSLADTCPGIVIEENGETLRDNAVLKARAAAKASELWTIADDTGLFVPCLDGEPGVRSARYAGDDATAAENRAKLLRQLGRQADAAPAAEFRCHVVLCEPCGAIVAEGQGHCRGRIIDSPRGDGGFGYDTLFELPEWHRTLAELGATATDMIGHRGRAIERLLHAGRTTGYRAE